MLGGVLQGFCRHHLTLTGIREQSLK
ncbi:MAG: hypothetical protein RIR08_495, partial [Pseudomonadota bacterium]